MIDGPGPIERRRWPLRTTPAKKALKQAARGIMFLDAHGPKDWRKHVDLERLLMQSCHDCVLGQLYTEFSIGIAIAAYRKAVVS